MLNEAERATSAGFLQAGLTLAWAGLEASLRRAALHAGLQGKKIGVQPTILIRELSAERILSQEESAFLEKTRQLRTGVAHGLAAQPIPPEVVVRIIGIAKALLPQDEWREKPIEKNMNPHQVRCSVS